MTPYGEALRTARGDMTQDELAKRSGVTQATISRIEKGLVSPTLRIVERLEAVVGPIPGTPHAAEHSKSRNGRVDSKRAVA